MRYHRFEGVKIGEIRENAMSVKIGGVWHWVPGSVVKSTSKTIGPGDEDEVVVEEWWAKRHGFA